MKKRWFTVLMAVLVTGLIIFTGCPTESDDSGGGVKFYKNVDIVVVGSGVAGIGAAVSAREFKSDIKVVLVETNAIAGGTLLMAGGGTSTTPYTWSSTSAAAYEPLNGTATATPSDPTNPASIATTNINRNSGFPVKSQGLIDRIFRGYATPDYSVPTAKALFDGPFATSGIRAAGTTNGSYGNEGFGTTGAAHADRVNRIINDKSKTPHIEFLPNHYATGLYMIDGVVSGITVKDSNDVLRTIKAKKVIIATGGFSRSPEWMARISNDDVPGIAYLAKWNRTTAMPSANGNFIPHVMAAGAALFPKWALHRQGLVFDQSLTGPVFQQIRYSGAPQAQMYNQIVVNNQGVRFMSENRGIAYGSGNMDGIHLFTNGRPPYYIIFSDENLPVTGELWVGDTHTKGDDLVPDPVIADITAVMTAQANNDGEELLTATNLTDLAKLMYAKGAQYRSNNGVVAERSLTEAQFVTAFIGTVERYNSYVENGTDTEFAVPTNRLTKKFLDAVVDDGTGGGPAATGDRNARFFALAIHPESHISVGGPVIDGFARIMKAEIDEIYLKNPTAQDLAKIDSYVIPNLYGVGEFANRFLYNVTYSHGAMSLIGYPTIGYVAAKHAVESIIAGK